MLLKNTTSGATGFFMCIFIRIFAIVSPQKKKTPPNLQKTFQTNLTKLYLLASTELMHNFTFLEEKKRTASISNSSRGVYIIGIALKSEGCF